jgi:hypothetical protein
MKQGLFSFFIGVTIGSIFTASLMYHRSADHPESAASRVGTQLVPTKAANSTNISDDNKYMGLPCSYQNLPGRTDWGFITAWDITKPSKERLMNPPGDKYGCEGFQDGVENGSSYLGWTIEWNASGQTDGDIATNIPCENKYTGGEIGFTPDGREVPLLLGKCHAAGWTNKGHVWLKRMVPGHVVRK